MFGLNKNMIGLNLDKITPKYIILCVSAPILIALYGIYRCKYINNHKDILEDEIFKGSINIGLDRWSISHFLLFLATGYLYPDTIIISLGLGILWELFETYVGIYKPKILMGIGFCETPNTDRKYKVWWYGKWSDIIVNFLGFIAGIYLNKKI